MNTRTLHVPELNFLIGAVGILVFGLIIGGIYLAVSNSSGKFDTRSTITHGTPR